MREQQHHTHTHNCCNRLCSKPHTQNTCHDDDEYTRARALTRSFIGYSLTSKPCHDRAGRIMNIRRLQTTTTKSISSLMFTQKDTHTFFVCVSKKKKIRFSKRHASCARHEAQYAFKISMIHLVLQFTLSIAICCVLHRCENQVIRC